MHGPQLPLHFSFSYILLRVLCSHDWQEVASRPRDVLLNIKLLEAAELTLQLTLSDPKCQDRQLPRAFPIHLYL